MKDYKVEMKPSWWHVTLSSGCYSDYTESHLFFAGNDENEVWNFLCRYIDDVSRERNYARGVENSIALAIKYGDKKYLSKKFTGNSERVRWDSEYDAANVEIERLHVIHFLK